MKPLKKINNIKASKGRLQLIAFVAIIGIIAFLLQMRPVAEKVGETFGWNSDKIQMIAEDIVRIALTIIMVTVAIIIFPISGIIAAVIGLIGLAISVPVIISYFPNENDKP